MVLHYLGKRLSFHDALCTVRYTGPLPDQKGDWLGVEWDDPDRGKHDGQYKGKRLFTTLSSSPICASFIRATRAADEPRDFLEALRYKYAEDGLAQTTGEVDGPIEISGKVVEEVGFERIRKRQALLHDLKIVLLDGLRIQGAVEEPEVQRMQEQIFSTCGNITELDVSRNLFEHWRDVLDICAPLRKLRLLKASGLRLESFDGPETDLFSSLEELHLNEGLLRPDQILDTLCWRTKEGSIEPRFPSLKSLSVAGSNIATFDLPTPNSINLAFTTVKTLIMDNNAFTSLLPLCTSLQPFFPNLTTLSLQHNRISDFKSPSSISEPAPPITPYPSLTTLNLSHNSITTPTLISSLPALFPNLTSLRTSHNPFFSSATTHHTEATSFLLTLARLPTLTTLNYSAITPKDRLDGELYYLSIAEKAIQAAFQTTGSLTSEAVAEAQREWGRYDELCEKHDRENLIEKLAAQVPAARPATASGTATSDKPGSIAYPPHSLGARLVAITFCLSTDDPNPVNVKEKEKEGRETVVLTIPRTLDVYRVKGLLMRKVGRQWGLRALRFAFYILPCGRGEEERGGEEGLGDEIPDSTRRIGDWIEEGVRECWVRVVPSAMVGNGDSWEAGRMDLSSLVGLMAG